jgi:thiamine biosynthesis lipoprotein
LSRPAPAATPAARLGVHRTTRWSTRIEVVVTDPAVTVRAARLLDDELDRVEAVASRFRDDSEVSRLCRLADGSPLPVSPDLMELLDVALRAASWTDGAVDPTVGAALCRLGYDRDFASVAGGVDGTLPDAAPVPGWQTVVLDRAASTVALQPGTVVDLGATAKAWAADRAAAVIAAQLGCGVLVSLGGDLAVESAPAGGFTVGVADICGDADAPTAVSIESGGLATSGVGNRHWLLGTTPVHHVVEPSTGLPVATPWRTVTVAAASSVDANTASTASLVLGPTAPDWLATRGLPARLVAHDGSVVTVAGWPDDPAPASAPASTTGGGGR